MRSCGCGRRGRLHPRRRGPPARSGKVACPPPRRGQGAPGTGCGSGTARRGPVCSKPAEHCAQKQTQRYKTKHSLISFVGRFFLRRTGAVAAPPRGSMWAAPSRAHAPPSNSARTHSFLLCRRCHPWGRCPRQGRTRTGPGRPEGERARPAAKGSAKAQAPGRPRTQAAARRRAGRRGHALVRLQARCDRGLERLARRRVVRWQRQRLQQRQRRPVRPAPARAYYPRASSPSARATSASSPHPHFPAWSPPRGQVQGQAHRPPRRRHRRGERSQRPGPGLVLRRATATATARILARTLLRLRRSTLCEVAGFRTGGHNIRTFEKKRG